MLSRIIFAVLIFFVFIFFYLKYFERSGIYYPEKDFIFTPDDYRLEYEDIFFVSEDNLRLNGWFIPAEAPRATILFSHGNAGNMSHRLQIIEIFHRLNLNVFIYDYRGYGKSQGVPSEQGLYRDVQAAYRYLTEQRKLDAASLVIFGKSIGANVAIDLASRVEAGLFISDSGFTSAYEMGRRLFPYLPVKFLISIKYDALSKIKDITIPKLIIHSQEDEIVPFRMGQRLFEAAAEPKEFYPMKGTHNEAIIEFEKEYYSKLDNFLTKYLP